MIRHPRHPSDFTHHFLSYRRAISTLWELRRQRHRRIQPKRFSQSPRISEGCRCRNLRPVLNLAWHRMWLPLFAYRLSCRKSWVWNGDNLQRAAKYTSECGGCLVEHLQGEQIPLDLQCVRGEFPYPSEINLSAQRMFWKRVMSRRSGSVSAKCIISMRPGSVSATMYHHCKVRKCFSYNASAIISPRDRECLASTYRH